MPPDAFASTINFTFSTLVDTAHADIVNCFTFLPSISVQGTPSDVCNCGTTTAPLATQGSTTGCAFNNSIYQIQQFPPGTDTDTPSAIVTPSATLPTVAIFTKPATITTSTTSTPTSARVRPICRDTGPYSSEAECSDNCVLGHCSHLSRRVVGGCVVCNGPEIQNFYCLCG